MARDRLMTGKIQKIKKPTCVGFFIEQIQLTSLLAQRQEQQRVQEQQQERKQPRQPEQQRVQEQQLAYHKQPRTGPEQQRSEQRISLYFLN